MSPQLRLDARRHAARALTPDRVRLMLEVEYRRARRDLATERRGGRSVRAAR